MPRFEYDIAFPDTVRQIVEPHLIRYARLVPSWCLYIRIEFNADPDPNDRDCVAWTKCFPEYRRAAITFFPPHIVSPPSYQERSVIHELLHIVHEPQRKCMQNFLHLLRECEVIADHTKAYLTEQMRVANESQTEDMQEIIWNLTHADPR